MVSVPRVGLTLQAANWLRLKTCEIEQGLKDRLRLRHTLGDRIIVRDEVLVWEGDKLLFRSKGHIVNQGLIALINLLSGISINNAASLPSGGVNTGYTWTLKNSGYMYVGTGSGVTVGSMTDLVTPVATKAGAQSGVTASPAAGTYRVSWIATWSAGALAAITVSELGLWLYVVATLQAFGAALSPGVAFVSRLSADDGDFAGFVVNVAVPLTVEWRLTFTFA